MFELRGQRVGVAEAVAGTFGIQPLDGAFGVPYQAAEPRDERLIRVPLRICTQMSQGVIHDCSQKVQVHELVNER